MDSLHSSAEPVQEIGPDEHCDEESRDPAKARQLAERFYEIDCERAAAGTLPYSLLPRALAVRVSTLSIMNRHAELEALIERLRRRELRRRRRQIPREVRRVARLHAWRSAPRPRARARRRSVRRGLGRSSPSDDGESRRSIANGGRP